MTIMTAATFHSIWTLVLFICMVGVFVWSFSRKRKAAFDEAAKLVFADEHSDNQGQPTAGEPRQ